MLAQKAKLLGDFMQAYRETIDAMYSDDAMLKRYADFAGVTEAVARQTRDQFFPKAAIDPNRLEGLDAVMADGVRFKFMTAPLTSDQLAQVLVAARFNPPATR